MKLLYTTFRSLFFVILAVSSAQSQTTVILIERATLPAVNIESSGVEANGRNNIWSHNDSGGDPDLYNFDSTGTLLRTLHISNATNVDWEEIRKDEIGNLYIGDFGNNNNDRKNLKIYKVAGFDTLTADTVAAAIINFSYADQSAFPPADPLKNFDTESMIVYQDSIYLFSKNRTSPYTGYTKMYVLPTIAGTYTAQLLDSFYTGPGPLPLYSMTSADISPDSTKLILLTNDKCWFFTNYTGNHFFDGDVTQFNFQFVSQKEAVCFISNDELYITDEYTNPIGRKLYYLNLEPYLTTALEQVKEKSAEIRVFPNPFNENAHLSIEDNGSGALSLFVYNATGEVIFNKALQPGERTVILDDKIFGNSSGFFFLELAGNGSIFRQKLIRMK